MVVDFASTLKQIYPIRVDGQPPFLWQSHRYRALQPSWPEGVRADARSAGHRLPRDLSKRVVP